MKRLMIFAVALIALPCMAQYGYYRGAGPAKSPEDEETMRQISTTLQNVQAELRAISQSAAGMDIEKQKKIAVQLKRLDADLKKYADPAGLQSAMTSLMTTIHGVGMQVNGANGSNLKALAENLKSIDTDLADAAGPEIISKMRNTQREGSAKGNLGAFRSALSIYYGDKEGKYPTAVAELMPKYLTRIPMLDIPNHKSTSEVRTIQGVQTMEELRARLKDAGQWLLVIDSSSRIAGTILIDCTHTDSRGVQWNSY